MNGFYWAIGQCGGCVGEKRENKLMARERKKRGSKPERVKETEREGKADKNRDL